MGPLGLVTQIIIPLTLESGLGDSFNGDMHNPTSEWLNVFCLGSQIVSLRAQGLTGHQDL